MSESFQEDRIREYLTTTRLHYATYHNHKEHMAYTIAALYLVGVSALITAPIAWCDIASPCLAFYVSTGVTGIVGTYVGWQLNKRHVAADIVAACDKVRVQWLTQIPSSLNVWSYCYKRITMPRFLVDELNSLGRSSPLWWVLAYVPVFLIGVWYFMFMYKLATVFGSPIPFPLFCVIQKP